MSKKKFNTKDIEYYLYGILIAIIVINLKDISSYVGSIFSDEDFFNNHKEIIEVLVIPFITFIIAIFGLYLLNKRVKEQQRQTNLQIEHKVDDRFNDSIKLLGSEKSSVRTSSIYLLYQLFIDDKKKKYRRQIANILCSHIRSTTQEKEYQKKYKEKPSNEIQTCINLMFKENGNIEGICSNYNSASDFDNPDLNNAFLRGADFIEAKCQGVDFTDTKCQGVNFRRAKCQGADFRYTKCQGADFSFAEFQGVNFRRAKCQGADFRYTKCQGADFSFAEFQGVNFRRAKCQGADFEYTKCQGADFTNAKFQGAIFKESNFQGAFALKNCNDNLEKRIGKNTELKDITLIGGFDYEEKEEIEKIKSFNKDLYEKLQKIIEDNKNIEPINRIDCKLPEGIIAGELKDSEEIQQAIKYVEKYQNKDKYLFRYLFLK